MVASRNKSKEAKQLLVATSVLTIIAQRGLEAVSVSSVARSSGVSRPWIYSNMAKSKRELIQLGAKQLGDIYTGPYQESRVHDLNSWLDSQVQDVQEGFDAAERYPWILNLYYSFRRSKNALGQTIDEIEKNYFTTQVRFAINAFKVKEEVARTIANTSTDIKMGFEFRAGLGALTEKDKIITLQLAREVLSSMVQTVLKFAKSKRT